ncbi:MAG: hypothetical protein D6731_25015 [Planctomycetota bacterium]|nr:MAG: hypothetical protein D6731_25015 [Planctomycetota bacterium]
MLRRTLALASAFALLSTGAAFAQAPSPAPPPDAPPGPAGGAPRRAPQGPAPLARLEDRALGPTFEQLAELRRLERRCGEDVSVSWDAASGAPSRVRFRPGLRLPPSGPERAARRFLARLARLYGLPALRTPEGSVTALEARAPRRVGLFTEVRLRQRLNGVPVEGAELRVLLLRREAPLGVLVEGRLFRDLPDGMGPPPARPTVPGPTGDPGVDQGRIEDCQLVVSVRSGRWDYAFRWTVGVSVSAELGLERSAKVVTDPEGRVLHWRLLGESALYGKVLPDAGGRALRTVKLPPLRLRRKGKAATLAGGGLRGAYERVLGAGAPHRLRERGKHLLLAYPPSDPRTLQVTALHNLARVRRFLSRYAREVGGAHLQPVTAAVQAGVANAFAMHDRRRTEASAGTLLFGTIAGRPLAADLGVVAHERGHLLLHSLGFGAGGGLERFGMHEGYADYLAAIVRGDPRLLGHVAGAARDLSVRKVWPRDGGEPHRVGWIYGGALWDLRSELGVLADRIALASVPLLGGDLLSGLDAVLEADRHLTGGRSARAIRKHFRDHGISRGGGKPPVVTPPLDRVVLSEGGNPEQRLLFEGTDPDGKAVRLTVSGLPFARVVATRPGKRAELELVLRFDGAYAGRHLLTVTAVDADGEVGGRVLPVLVRKEDRVREDLAVYRLAPGEERRIPLDELVDLGGKEAARGARYWIAGQVGPLAQLEDGALRLRAQPGDVGVHGFELRAMPRGRHRVLASVVRPVKVIVGDGPWIRVFDARRDYDRLGLRAGEGVVEPAAREGTKAGSYTGDPNLGELPPATEVSVVEGKIHRFEVTASRRVAAEVDRAAGAAPILSCATKAPFVRWEADEARGGEARGTVVVRPPSGSAWRTIVVTFTAADPGATPARTARRRLRIHVVPDDAQPPTLSVRPEDGVRLPVSGGGFESAVLLYRDFGVAEFTATNPEGGPLRLEVFGEGARVQAEVAATEKASRSAGPSKALAVANFKGPVASGKLRFRWRDRAAYPRAASKDDRTPRRIATLVVRATGANGLSTQQRVLVAVRPVPKTVRLRVTRGSEAPRVRGGGPSTGPGDRRAGARGRTARPRGRRARGSPSGRAASRRGIVDRLKEAARDGGPAERADD